MAKANKIIYWIATVWLALGMVSTGLVQLLKGKAGTGGIDMIAHLGYPASLLTLLGICKLLGAGVVLAPRLPLLKEWAYAGFFFMMAGAVYAHVAVGDAITQLFPALLLVVLTIVSWYLRPAGRKVMQLTSNPS